MIIRMIGMNICIGNLRRAREVAWPGAFVATALTSATLFAA